MSFCNGGEYRVSIKERFGRKLLHDHYGQITIKSNTKVDLTMMNTHNNEVLSFTRSSTLAFMHFAFGMCFIGEKNGPPLFEQRFVL